MRPATRGIGVLEVLLAFTIFSLCSEQVLALFHSQEQTSVSMAERVVVTNRARELVDSLESWCISNRYSGTHRIPPRPCPTGELVGLEMEEEAVVESVAAQAGLFRIRATVRWKRLSGRKTVANVETISRLTCDPEWGFPHGVDGGTPGTPKPEEEG
jgi:hypothetical protein